jgi:hypothetical protein
MRPDESHPFFFETNTEVGEQTRADFIDMGVLSIVHMTPDRLQFIISHPCDTIEELKAYKAYFTTSSHVQTMIEYCNTVGHTFTWTYDSIETETIWNNLEI